MKLKKVYDNEADVPADHLSLYEERDGKWHLTVEIEGTSDSGDVARLNSALAKERNDHKTTKDKLRAFDGLDPQETRDRLDKLADIEANPDATVEQRVTSEVERRLKAKTAPLERQIAQANEAKVAAERERDETRGTLRGRTISDEVRAAASKAKIIDSAVDDVLMYGTSVFEVGEDGSVVTKDGVGVTPGLRPEAWLSDMKERRPHWWPASQGAGSQGGRGGSTGGDNPFTAEAWNVTEQGKIAQADEAKAHRLAKAAGTTLGGAKPAPRSRAA
ncbi:hypothetical protein [Methylobacterium sp. WL6]|uniref:hypothetical protein n=1 Tax=Methylobacterium sp. WL6 TaxID=2603901 RepID=UPI0011CA3566|nr:hypothetical protein [Methylobacterium sp. WL6]TXN72391.1 hypothetical protein FV230_05030 [Methylobacterium sp. WL6]